MGNRSRSRAAKRGLPPGSLVYVGDKRTDRVRIRVIEYDATHIEERELSQPEECAHYRDRPTVSWINIDGIDHVDIVKKIGSIFGLHPLVMEDILNTTQRPKRVLYDGSLFLVLKMLSVGKGAKVQFEQVSLVVGRNFVLSFQEEGESDVFDKVREALRRGADPIRKQGAGYLAYALIDMVVDNYFSVLEVLGENLEDLEQGLVDAPSESHLRQVYGIKREILVLRRAVWPLREMISGLERGECPLIPHEVGIYLRDAYDHIIEVIEVLEMYRDMTSGLLEVYLSSINNRINQVMKILAMVATVFMPLTLISSIYGMNFHNMPELQWTYGYPFALLLMGIVAVTMLIFFRRRGWL